jgi:hypothetical protein
MNSLPKADSFIEDIEDLEVADQSELVLLAVFAHQQPLDAEVVPTLDIRDTVREYNGEVDTSEKLKELVSGGYLQRQDGPTYQLSAIGMERCLSVVDHGEAITDELSFVNPNINQEVYAEYVPRHESYLALVDEINASYRVGNNTSVAVLLRRLFEDLTWQIAKHVYDDTEMFLTDDKNPLNFGSIVKKLKKNKDPVRGIDPRLDNSTSIEKFLNDIDEIRELGNESAHGVTTNLSREDLDAISHRASECIELCYTLIHSENKSTESS